MVAVNDQDFTRALEQHLQVPIAPEDVKLNYLTEGAANVIWALQFNSDTDGANDGPKYVLRLRKDLPSLCSTTTLQEQQTQQIAPLFASHPSLILPTELLKLSENVVNALNEELYRLEHQGLRPKPRTQVYHPSFDIEPFAIITTNLFYGRAKCLEFKPKWLSQSASAPPGAQRCRTCAMNAMRRSQGKHQGKGDSGLCPLDLLSEDQAILSAALGNIWRNPRTLPSFIADFRQSVQPVLKHIQMLQVEHNKVGLSDFREPEGKDLPVAMALRDCSVFLKAFELLSKGFVQISDIKLLDLDLKSAAEDKTAKWAQMEADLIDGDWYLAAKSPEVSCALGRVVP